MRKPSISYILHLFSPRDSELLKQHQFVSQEMMKLVCDLKSVQRQEIPIKACVVFHDTDICF